MKKIAILGSTGSIGTQTLEVVDQNPGEFEITALAAGHRTEVLQGQVRKYRPELVVTALEKTALEMTGQFPGTEVMWGEAGLVAAACSGCDLVVNALSGMKGMIPTYEAVRRGKEIALANKETLVAGGLPVMEEAGKRGVRILPIDSEHSAVFQCLQGGAGNPPKGLILTASGGPFRGWSKAQMKKATLEQALSHPNWSMGPKITIDSATMMNKGLEVIEAMWLFDMPPDQIQVLVHPQSIVHSMVEFQDGAVLAQMGLPDMKLPIAYALTYPRRKANPWPTLNLAGTALTFEKPDLDAFPALALAYEAARTGGVCPAVMNAANEVAVAWALAGKIQVYQIPEIISDVLDRGEFAFPHTVEGILEADRLTRISLEEQYGF